MEGAAGTLALKPSPNHTCFLHKAKLFLLTWLGDSLGWLQGRGVWSAACRTPEVEAERPRR